jgi:hypothetical protein
MSGKVFVNYRRNDSSASAGRLYDRLAARFPKNQIFIDVDNLDPGIDFVEAIEQSVGSCDVLIAVIGRYWLSSSEAEGSRRLDNPDDFVRLEIATALKRKIRVIPVLVDGASLPRPSDLPDDLKSLLRRNAVEVSHTRFGADSDRLIAAIERVFEKIAAEQRESEEKARLEAERREAEKNARLEAERRQREEQDRREAEQREHEEKERLAAEHGENELKERLEAERQQKEERDRLEAEQREKERLEAEQREKERLEAERCQREEKDAASLVFAFDRKRLAEREAEEKARSALEGATKDHPWVNSLGMKFVPVAGTEVLFSVWDTRVQDFETFVKSTGYNATRYMYSLGKDRWTEWKQRGATWKEPGFSQGVTHPVVGVNWFDAQEFCMWLAKREQGSGMLPRGRAYRLPTDAEWSIGVGLQGEEGTNPKEKAGKIKLYPWGKEWPPPKGAGNYAGEEAKKEDWPSDFMVLKGTTTVTRGRALWEVLRQTRTGCRQCRRWKYHRPVRNKRDINRSDARMGIDLLLKFLRPSGGFGTSWAHNG